MSQTRIDQEKYVGKILSNSRVEWLMEYGKIREVCFFKGACGDRYTIYVATKRNKNIVDFHTVYNMYEHGTSDGTHIAVLNKDYILRIIDSGNRWYSGCGHTVKQLMRQGVCPKANNYDIRWCRTSYMLRFRDKFQGKTLIEVAPWNNMKLNLKGGRLVNMPPAHAKKAYNKAKATDRKARKANYLANKNNIDALARYRKAGGDTEAARGAMHDGRWRNPEVGDGTKNIDWSMIPIDDVFKHRNVTLRSNIMEHYGMDAILKTLQYKVVDEHTVDNRPYRLLDVVIPDLASGNDRETNGLYLEMLNPSTGESHFEGIQNPGGWGSPKEATVKEALKWRDGDTGITGDTLSDGATLDYINPVVLT